MLKIIGLLLLLSVFGFVGLAQSQEQPAPQTDNQPHRTQEPQNQPQHRMFSRLDFISNYCTSQRNNEQAEWRKKFICEGKITDVTVALFTVVLTVFTGLLVLIGGQQARLTRETLASTQRAYVFALGFVPIWEVSQETGEYVWRFRPTWKNSGLTPTKDFISHTCCELRDRPLPKGFDFNYPTPRKGGGLIGPDETVNGGLAPPVPERAITAADIREVQAGRKHLYLWGWARYYDVFPRTPRHLTRFCWWVTPFNDPDTFRPGQDPKTDLTVFRFPFIHHFEGNSTAEEPRRSKYD